MLRKFGSETMPVPRTPASGAIEIGPIVGGRGIGPADSIAIAEEPHKKAARTKQHMSILLNTIHLPSLTVFLPGVGKEP
jgi:hypothetical protein